MDGSGRASPSVGRWTAGHSPHLTLALPSQTNKTTKHHLEKGKQRKWALEVIVIVVIVVVVVVLVVIVVVIVAVVEW